MKKNRTEQSISNLIERWQRDVEKYPDTPEGRYAAVIVGLCIAELKTAVWGSDIL